MLRSSACFAILIILLLCGCAGLHRDLEPPTVGVSSFRLLPSAGMAPRFEIGLHIVNPNRTALTLEGLAYTVEIEGRRILTGVSRDLPRIPAYGEQQVTLIATTDLLSSIRLFGELLNQPRDQYAYELDAKLDVGGWRPPIHVLEKGRLRLSDEAP